MASHNGNGWHVTYTKTRKAVLRNGPIRLIWSSAPASTVLLMRALSAAIYFLAFLLYATTSIAYRYPNGHGNWWFGFLHGHFAIPSFILSWFNHDITIYQSPNNGFWYNLWFLLGIGTFATFARSTD